MNATSVRNETALVAGGSRGLGLLVARELAERGYRVHVCARDADELARGAALLAREGLHITTAVCDVTDANAVARWVESAADDDAPISVAIAVAGVIQVGSIEAEMPTMFEMVAVGAMATQLELRIPKSRIRCRSASKSRRAVRSIST